VTDRLEESAQKVPDSDRVNMLKRDLIYILSTLNEKVYGFAHKDCNEGYIRLIARNLINLRVLVTAPPT
jgi:hypothetical protein